MREVYEHMRRVQEVGVEKGVIDKVKMDFKGIEALDDNAKGLKEYIEAVIELIEAKKGIKTPMKRKAEKVDVITPMKNFKPPTDSIICI